ncbi:MAG: hypothetical protein ACE5I3_00450 [Phycisphaerae bacterium]
MTPEELLFALFKTMTEHLRLPEGYEWAALAGAVVVTGFGLLLLVRGARWAPGLAALAFLAAGGFAGSFLARAVGTPFWPTVGVVGVLGFVLGLLLFHVWQAILLASCFVIAGLSVYYVRGLYLEVDRWNSLAPGATEITLPMAGTVVGENRLTAMQDLSSLWTHLSENVGGFQTTFWSLVLSTGLAGLIFGLLLPRASRALWAASLGTMFFGIGTTGLLMRFGPGILDWLRANHVWAWGIVGLVWLISLAYNLATCRRRKSEKRPVEAKAATKSKPATA